MALRIIGGVPGGGKTFYAVRHIAKNYFKKNDNTGVYELARECLIITNIDDFQPDHVDLKKEIDAAGSAARSRIENSGLSDREIKSALNDLDPVSEFFSFEYQEKYKEGKPNIVYVIDEAQRYFRRGSERSLKDNKVFDYFEYHRHWGQEIYLITQNEKKLPPDIVYLVEYIISAVPRSRTIGYGFKYNWVSGSDIIRTETCLPDKGVFALYKSMDSAESEKVKNPMLPKIGMTLLASGLILYGGYRYFGAKYRAGLPQASDSSVSPVPSSVPSSSGSVIPVGTLREPEKSPYVVFVPLSSITTYRNGDQFSSYVWRGQLIPPDRFPHKTVYMAGRRYAVLEYDLFAFMFPEDDPDRPRDFIVQVAPHEKETTSATLPRGAIDGATGAEEERGGGA